MGVTGVMKNSHDTTMQFITSIISGYSSPGYPTLKQPNISKVQGIVDLCNGQLEILHVDMSPPFPQSKHSRLGTNGFDFCTACYWHLFCNLLQIHILCEIHFATVDFEDVGAGFEGWFGEEDFAVDSTGAEKCWIQRIKSICSHDNLDVGMRFKAVELIEKFEHCPLNLRITSS